MSAASVDTAVVRVLLPACALAAVAVAFPTRADVRADPKAATRLEIVGQWQLVPERSDDGDRALEVLMPGRDRDGDGSAEPRGPMGGRGRPGGMGGGGMGRPGGMGGFPGGDGGGRMRPPGERLSPEERAAVRRALQFAVESPESLEIRQHDAELVITYPGGRKRQVVADGRKRKLDGCSQKARWKNGRLVVETQAGIIKIKEELDTVAEHGLLHINATVDHPRYEGELKLTRVYRRSDATAPPTPDAATDVPEHH